MVVKRAGFRGITIRSCEVDCNVQTDFTTTEDIFEEGMPLRRLQLCKVHAMVSQRTHPLVRDLILEHILPDLSQRHRGLSNVPMLTRFLREEEVNADLSLDIIAS